MVIVQIAPLQIWIAHSRRVWPSPGWGSATPFWSEQSRFGGVRSIQPSSDWLSQAQGEDWHGSEAKIKKFIKEKLGNENVEIQRAHRIGKEERNDPSQKRTNIAKFLNYKDKEKVPREYRFCKRLVERLYINEDFSKETMEIRKEHLKQAKELRKKGKFVKIIQNRLISFDARQNPSEFYVGNEEQGAS